MSLNKDDAVAYLNAHAFAHSLGKRAAFVRRAIEDGGLTLDPHPVSAIAVPAKNSIPTKGDVVVIQNDAGGDSAGHIAMYDGLQWVSDFKQRDIWAGPGYRKAHPAMQGYRP